VKAQDHYAVLGVAPDATQEQIKAAYEVLSDPARRRKYDKDRDAGAAADRDPALEYPPPSAPYEVAQKIYAEHGLGGTLANLLAWRGGWMAWRTTHWVEVDVAELRQAIYGALSKVWYVHETATTIEQRAWSPDRHKMANVLEALAAVVHLSSEVDPPSWMKNSLHSALPARPDSGAAQTISCRNGLLDLRTRTLSKHTPALFNLVSVPFDFDPAAPEPALWLQFLQQLWGDDHDSIDLLQARRSDLKYPDRGGQIPQPPRPQIHQINSAEQTRRRLGQQDLTAMPGGHHPRGSIEHRTEVIAVPKLGFAGRQPHPHRQLKRPLRGHRCIRRRLR
jgi:D5 N terminal like